MALCAVICACPRLRKFAKDDFWIDALGVLSIDVLWFCDRIICHFLTGKWRQKRRAALGAHGAVFLCVVIGSYWQTLKPAPEFVGQDEAARAAFAQGQVAAFDGAVDGAS